MFLVSCTSFVFLLILVYSRKGEKGMGRGVERRGRERKEDGRKRFRGR